MQPSKYRRSYKGSCIDNLPLPSSLLHRPFYFFERNYRETSALLVLRSRSGLYFQQCVIWHALTPVVYFGDVYSPRENKKRPERAAGCRRKPRMQGIIPTTARVPLQRTAGSRYFIITRSTARYLWFGTSGKKDWLWTLSQDDFGVKVFPERPYKSMFPNSFKIISFLYSAVYIW